MSDTELHIGKLVKVAKAHENETLEEVCKRLVDIKKIDYSESEDSFYEILREDDYNKYFQYNGELWQAEDKELDGGDAFCEMAIEKDGSIKYVTSFYNGGTCFSEMVEESLEKLEEKLKKDERD